jgi:hypothetical protein
MLTYFGLSYRIPPDWYELRSVGAKRVEEATRDIYPVLNDACNKPKRLTNAD